MDSVYLSIVSKIGTIQTLLKLFKKVPKELSELTSCITQLEKILLKAKSLKCGKATENEIMEILQLIESILQEVYKSRSVSNEQNKSFFQKLRLSGDDNYALLSISQSARLQQFVNALQEKLYLIQSGFKLLVAGLSGSGKSCLLKQVTDIYKPLSDNDKKQYIGQIQTDLIRGIAEIYKVGKAIGAALPEESASTLIALTPLMGEVEDVIHEVEILSKTQEVSNLMKRSIEFPILLPLQYYLKNPSNSIKRGYVPSTTDILYCTAGPKVANFEIDGCNTGLIEVPNENYDKWIKQQQHVHGILYLVDLSCYHDITKSPKCGLEEAAQNFGTFVSKLNNSTCVFLVLTKKDVFQEQLKYVPFNSMCTDYQGTGDYSSALDYIKKKILKEDTRLIPIPVQVYVINSFDKSQISTLMNSLQTSLSTKRADFRKSMSPNEIEFRKSMSFATNETEFRKSMSFATNETEFRKSIAPNEVELRNSVPNEAVTNLIEIQKRPRRTSSNPLVIAAERDATTESPNESPTMSPLKFAIIEYEGLKGKIAIPTNSTLEFILQTSLKAFPHLLKLQDEGTFKLNLFDEDIQDYIDVFTIQEIPKKPKFLLQFKKNETFLTNIKIQHRIGRGNFGEVFKGLMDETIEVALKKPLAEEAMLEFRKEVALMSSLSHKNIVKFFGIYQENEDKYLVMEYMNEGNLKELLERERKTLQFEEMLEMMVSTSIGMEYLESEGILHRDLATRNLLVAKEKGEYIIKLSDFGFAKQSEYYKSISATLPIRWSAPEVLSGRGATHKSDVYAFGVVIWEILELGMKPFPNIAANDDVIYYVLEGGKLTKPNICTAELWSVVEKCCEREPEARPNFKTLTGLLKKIQTSVVDIDYSFTIIPKIKS